MKNMDNVFNKAIVYGKGMLNPFQNKNRNITQWHM